MCGECQSAVLAKAFGFEGFVPKTKLMGKLSLCPNCPGSLSECGSCGDCGYGLPNPDSHAFTLKNPDGGKEIRATDETALFLKHPYRTAIIRDVPVSNTLFMNRRNFSALQEDLDRDDKQHAKVEAQRGEWCAICNARHE